MGTSGILYGFENDAAFRQRELTNNKPLERGLFVVRTRLRDVF